MPSVTTTINASPASAASSTASAAAGAGTITIVAVAPVSRTASATDANTGMPSTSVPAFLGDTPPTTCVPYAAVAQPVEAALPAGQALHDDLRVRVHQDAHRAASASSTALRAASTIVGRLTSRSDS